MADEQTPQAAPETAPETTPAPTPDKPGPEAWRENIAPGKRASFDAQANKIAEWQIDGYGRPIPEAGAVEPPAKEAAGTPPATETPAEEAAETRTVEQQLEDARKELEERNREMASLRTAQARVRLQPAAAPQQEEAPKLDFSDRPDFSDEDAYPSDEAAARGQEEYYERKVAEHQQALAEHNEKQAAKQRAASEQHAAAEAAEGRKMATYEAIQKSLGVDDAEYVRVATEYGQVRHPQASPATLKQGSINPIAELLYTSRDQYLQHRAALGLPVTGHETVAEVQAEQLRDMDYARGVAALVPDHMVGGLFTVAVAQSQSPTRLLKHFATEEGQKEAARIIAPFGDGRGVARHVLAAVQQEIAGEVARVDARLAAAPAKQTKTRTPDADPGRRAPAVRASRRGAAAAPSPTADADPLSQEWQNNVWKAAQERHRKALSAA